MAQKDLHDKPFDGGTIAKLEIFEDYAQAWIPTFVMTGMPVICIFDFFAGTGYDKAGIEGSPIRILNKIKQQVGNIFQKKVKVKLYLNEYKTEKYDLLKVSVESFLNENQDVKRAIEVVYDNEDFSVLFDKYFPIIEKYPSLVFLDQNGIKFLSPDYLLKLEKTNRTDFLYFLSASYIWRFGDTDEFKKYLELDMDEVKQNPYQLVHRSVIEQLKHKYLNNSKLKLYPYSIKKQSNIYGIIFGATHPLAFDKFLGISWKRNSINGDADFDIDDDSSKIQIDMFEGKKLTKIEKFEIGLRDEIVNGAIKNNYDALEYAYSHGHVPKHVADVLRSMKKQGLIRYDSQSPCVTYDNVYKKDKVVSYTNI
ncbi:MAG: three-Cys-motif partner protein TcmP [Bacteroidota bacterium]